MMESFSSSARKAQRRWKDDSKHELVLADKRALLLASKGDSECECQSNSAEEHEEEKEGKEEQAGGELFGQVGAQSQSWREKARDAELWRAAVERSGSLRAKILGGMYRSLQHELGPAFGPHDLLPSFYGCRRGEGAVDVFLGGACNPTTWRLSAAVPFLRRHGVSFFNPQVEEWRPELVAIEAHMKAQARVLFFVIGQTRSIASMVEVAELMACQRRMVLVVEPFRGESAPKSAGARGNDCSAFIASHLEAESRDLVRGRTYLRDAAVRHGVDVYDNVPDGLRSLLLLLHASV